MRLGLIASLLCLCTVSLCLADPAKAAIRKDLNVPPEDLSPALQTVATTYELQVLYPTQVAKDLKTHGAIGSFTPDDALKAVLSGTGLSYKYLDAKTVTVFATAAPAGVTAAAGQDQTNTTQDNSKEAGKKSSQDFRVAQVDQDAAGPSTVENNKEKESNSKKKSAGLEEIVVTGSRIPMPVNAGPQDVVVYTALQIQQSGQTNISDFLNTLPSVSVGSTEAVLFGGATSVTLRGLPVGTTLVLINGRRVETSGTQYASDFFDLSNIPVAAVERIEVVADGSSAVYGSDAIGGVVNIILKKDVDGAEANIKGGWADNTHEYDASLAFGKRFDQGSFSVVASYQTRGALSSSARALTASNDYTTYGGPNNNFPICGLANVFSVDGVTPLPGAPAGNPATYAAFSGPVTNGKPSTASFNYGGLNTCSLGAGGYLIPASYRTGVFAQGQYQMTPSLELFTELMYSHVLQDQVTAQESLFGDTSFQSYTMSGANPHNPFGTTVGVTKSFASALLGNHVDTDFFRPLVGARGKFGDYWQWELSALSSVDRSTVQLPNAITDMSGIQNALNSSDPDTALNPFAAETGAQQSLIHGFFSDGLITSRSSDQSISGFLRGRAFDLPSGAINVVVGSEYHRDTIRYDLVNDGVDPPNTQQSFSRRTFAIFGEARIPIIGQEPDSRVGDKLAVTVAGRYDHYSDFGSKSTPQIGIEWRPASSLLVRGTYAQAFRAPSLYDLYNAQSSSPGNAIVDPSTGSTVFVPVVSGGNSHLRPLTGESHSVGAVYSGAAVPDLRLSLTAWTVSEHDAIPQFVPAQFFVDNPTVFPGRVVRDSSGQITEVIDTPVNFGSINVAGLDYQIAYRYHSPIGIWSPSISATQTYRYSEALTPGAPALNGVSIAQDTNAWAPRWKGSVAVGWERGPITANIDGRYVSRYQDYDSSRQIGNFWLCDFNARYSVGQMLDPDSRVAKGLYVEMGAVNLFNSLPQYSNYFFSLLGYDASQADIRGRFVYVRIGMRL